jgi:hypothetical protein
MKYSIPETKQLFERWKESGSIIRITFSDVALSGMLSALVRKVSTKPPTELDVECVVLLPNGIPGSSLVSIHFWGTEQIDLTDFTREISPMVSADDLMRFNCCLSIQYETGSMLNVCEAWPDPSLDVLRKTQIPTSDIKAMLEFFNEQFKNKS